MNKRDLAQARAEKIAREIEKLCSKHCFDIVSDKTGGVSIKVLAFDENNNPFYAQEKMEIVPF